MTEPLPSWRRVYIEVLGKRQEKARGKVENGGENLSFVSKKSGAAADFQRL